MIVAGGLAVMVLSAQDDLDTVRQAAEQGDADAQFYLGVMYASGQGVPEDDAEAVKWYRRAAEQGEKAEAQLSLGFMNYLVEGVPKNNAEAGSGSGSQPNRASPRRNWALASCTNKAGAYRKITCSLMPGTTLPPRKGTSRPGTSKMISEHA